MNRFLAPLLLALAALGLPAAAQEYHDIDVDLPAYPEMQPVEDLPVYYAPAVDSNYFFYDGLYWDYYDDGWYSSPWYNGPWTLVDPVYVPTYLLWVPVRYYHRPPAYFRGWARDRAPRWGAHWGPRWQEAHNRIYTGPRTAVQRAPLPQYQRQYTQQNYPRAPQVQTQLHAQQYAYRPQDRVVQQQYQHRGIAQVPPHGGGQPHPGGEEHRGR